MVSQRLWDEKVSALEASPGGVGAERAVVPVDQVDVVAAEPRVEDEGPQHRVRLGRERAVRAPLLHEVVRPLHVGLVRVRLRVSKLGLGSGLGLGLG